MITKILKSIDCGKISGIYMIFLGVVYIIVWIFGGIVQDRSISADFSFLIFFLAAYLLIKHKNFVRKIVIVISFIGVIGTVVDAFVFLFEPSNNRDINLFIYEMKNPSYIIAFIAIFVSLIIYMIPILLLYNDKARQEFVIATKSTEIPDRDTIGTSDDDAVKG